jgi:hypothetical protein
VNVAAAAAAAEALYEVFDPRRPLRALKVLQIDRMQQWQCLSPGTLAFHGLAHCCPNLQQLQIGAQLAVGADLTPLTQLQQLAELVLVPATLNTTTATCLASLTGLKKLTLHTSRLSDEALLQLDHCWA